MDEFFTIAPMGDFTVVEFQTPSLMSGTEIDQISNQILTLVDQGAELLLLDFKKVEFLSSQAIGLVVSLNKRISRAKGGRLVLCGVSPSLLALLKITRLDKVLTIRKTREEAVAGS